MQARLIIPALWVPGYRLQLRGSPVYFCMNLQRDVPPFFLLLTTKVRTKTMSNALSSVERQSCVWKPTNVQISHTPPSRCLTFRFGRKKFFFLICLDEMPRSSFAVRSLESGNYLYLMYYKICNCQSDFIMTPSLKAIFCPRLLSLFFNDFVDIHVPLSTPQKAVLPCCCCRRLANFLCLV